MAPKDGSHRSFHLRKTLADLTTKARTSRRKHQVIPLPALPSNLDAKDDYVYDILYECQRGSWMVGYSSKTLLQFDPNPWCDANMNFTPMKPSTFQLPDPTWEWVNKEWLVDLTGDVDEAGWQYAVRFHGAKWHGNYKHFRSFVRRRRWIRLRHKMKPHAATDAQQQHDTIPAATPARVGQLVDIDDQVSHQHHHHISASATSNDDAVGWTTRFTRARLDRERIQVLTNLPVPEKVALLAKQTLV
ncbi:hypothetical protein BC940DRAFT_299758 [Gongronella butleri]|nr:hypothetical protein BC940DRAFT_299758 [Gongronella butleri]